VRAAGRLAEADAQRGLLRDLFGNPFAPVAFEPAWSAWQGGVVAQLARTIYAERRWDELPVLADALEDAGCRSDAVLGHCRSGGPHARGCWVIDRLAGRGGG
jgi:hypothetical protein